MKDGCEGGRAHIPSRAYKQSQRAKAAEATGDRIVEVFLARLMEQWFDQVTLAQVAADAGVTVQTVLRRFAGKEGLLREAVTRLASQINARRVVPTYSLSAVVASLLEDYEQTGDSVIRLLALEGRHEGIADLLDFGRGQHRDWVLRTFPSPLEQAAVDSLVIATDVYTWKLLRRDMRRGLDVYKSTVTGLIESILDGRRKESL